jgi:hypothetical protein
MTSRFASSYHTHALKRSDDRVPNGSLLTPIPQQVLCGLVTRLPRAERTQPLQAVPLQERWPSDSRLCYFHGLAAERLRRLYRSLLHQL